METTNHFRSKPQFALELKQTKRKNKNGFLLVLFKWGTATTILLLSRQTCGEIMTQNLCSKQETLLQPQEEDIKGFLR